MEHGLAWKRCADELPDDDLTVLIALADGEVWTGFRDGGIWRYVSADQVECVVTHWMDFPEPPTEPKSEDEDENEGRGRLNRRKIFPET